MMMRKDGTFLCKYAHLVQTNQGVDHPLVTAAADDEHHLRGEERIILEFQQVSAIWLKSDDK